jgi:hypothetical protein
VGASASCSLHEVVTASPPPPPPLILKDLSLRYPSTYCSLSDALLLIQVTEFSCGGFVVGATWNHIIADAAGIAQFLQAVGELARGMPAPSVVPVRLDVSLPCRPPLPRSAPALITTEEMASLDFTVSSSLITRIKAECGGCCTVFDAVAAVLWRCRTRAVMSDAEDTEATATLGFMSNVREVVGAKDGYYGNCITVQVVRATAGTVAGSDIKDLVKLIRIAKEKIPDMFGRIGGDGGAGTGTDQQQQEAPEKYNTLAVSSWRNLGLEMADFGSGRPAQVMWQKEKTVGLLCILCPPCKGKHGVNVMSTCVRAEHAGGFLGELATLNSTHNTWHMNYEDAHSHKRFDL